MTAHPNMTYKAVAVGTSTGGFQALTRLLRPLPADFSLPILAVRHQLPTTDAYLIRALSQECQLLVDFACEGDVPAAGRVYIAPPDRHLLVNQHGILSLSSCDPVNFSRPSIDPLFESAAKYYGPALVAVVLTGANRDGAAGVVAVKRHGGRVLVQDPASAEAKAMPEAALAVVDADSVVLLDQIGPLLWSLARHQILS